MDAGSGEVASVNSWLITTYPNTFSSSFYVGYVDFDINSIPQGSEIIGATLELKEVPDPVFTSSPLVGCHTDENMMSLMFLEEAWHPDTIGPGNLPKGSIVTDTTNYGEAGIGECEELYYDVKNIVQNWVDGKELHGFGVAGPLNDYWEPTAAYKTICGNNTEPAECIPPKLRVKWVEKSVETITDNSGLGMAFVRIPAGTFTMGSPDAETGSYDRERPQHEVTLSQDFYIMTTEVTQAQWVEVMGSNPSYFDSCGGDCPVERVSWNDIQDFITALNALDGRTYRLPTEAEWEYAARAGTTTAFYNGDITQEGYDPIDPNLDAIGWYRGNSGSTTHLVAQKLPNAWGLFDMSGNVWEWVQDWYGNYPENAVTDPVGPETASYRVARGGSWNDSARYCRSAHRNRTNPSNRVNGLGFRLALSPGR